MYLPAVAGVGFSSHYCMGELKDTKVFTVEKQECCDEETEEENGCCSDDITIIKLDNDQISAENRQPVKPQVTELFILSEIFSAATATTAASEENILLLDCPSPQPPPNLTILYCNFLI